MMAYNKMNKTHRCACRLKCKNKFTIKKSPIFKQSWTFPKKFFGADSIPNVTIKRSTKVFKKSVDFGDFERENRHGSKTHITPPCHNKQTSHPRTTYTHSPPNPYLVREESVSLLIYRPFIYSKINEMKSIYFIHCLLLWTFCPHLGSFFVVSSSLRFSQISPLAFFRWLTATSDRNAESCNRIPSNYCLP